MIYKLRFIPLYLRLLLNNIAQIKILIFYKLKFNLIAPNFIKRKLIHLHSQKLSRSKNIQIKTIVETGTYLGQTIKYFYKKNYICYSIEIDSVLNEFNLFRFRNVDKINLLKGDSKLELNKVVNMISEPCIFFLDAHASGGITSQSDTASVLKDEIDILSNYKHIKDSLIIIDDVRGLDGTNSYPTIEAIKDKLEQVGLKNFQITSDMLFASS